MILLRKGSPPKKFKILTFSKKGGMVDQKVYIFKKYIHSEKKEINFEECVLVSSKSNRRSFGTPTCFLKLFVKKLTIGGGWGGGPGQFGTIPLGKPGIQANNQNL